MKKKPLTQMYLDFGQVNLTARALLEDYKIANLASQEHLHSSVHQKAAHFFSSEMFRKQCIERFS
jgi:hypothetical protein